MLMEMEKKSHNKIATKTTDNGYNKNQSVCILCNFLQFFNCMWKRIALEAFNPSVLQYSKKKKMRYLEE